MDETRRDGDMQARNIDRGSPQGTEPSEELVRGTDRDALSRLVREVNDGGVSYQRMADRTASPETGETLSKPYFQKLATNSVTTAPTEARLRAIAVGLGKPLRVVQRAAAIQYLAYEATELAGYDDDVRIILAHVAGMPSEERKRWRRMIEAAGRDE